MAAVGAPWSVQIELTEGCNRVCSFCGLNGIRNAPGNYKYMSVQDADTIATELAALAPKARYEFAMHGEPMKNPEHATIIGIFRYRLPKAQLQVTTNGITMLKDMQQSLELLFAAGVNFVVLDTYYPERDRLRSLAATLKDIDVVDYYDDWLPAGRTPYRNHGLKINRTVVLMDDLEARNGESKSRTIYNHAGNNPSRPIPKQPLVKKCTLPFRELSVCWNGNVNVCCQDWQHEYTTGNILEQSAAEIWFGAAFEAARTKLYNKERDFDPCSKCDIGSGARVGLLPAYPSMDDDKRAVLAQVQVASAGYDARDFIKLRRSR